MGPNYKQLKDKAYTFSLTTRYLIGAARSSLKISLMLNMMLFFMRPGSGSCHRWKKEIRTGPKATREKVGWYWYIYILCIVTYQTSNRWESANIAQTCAGRTPYPSNSITCSSCTAMVFKKWCAISRADSGSAPEGDGGATGSCFRALVWMHSFKRAGVRRKGHAVLLRQVGSSYSKKMAAFIFLVQPQNMVAGSQEAKCRLKYVIHTPGGPVQP